MDNITLSPAQLKWLDEASYADLLARWRYGRKGEVWFCGTNATRYKRIIEQRKLELLPFEAERIEKEVGWSNGRFWENVDKGNTPL